MRKTRPESDHGEFLKVLPKMIEQHQVFQEDTTTILRPSMRSLRKRSRVKSHFIKATADVLADKKWEKQDIDALKLAKEDAEEARGKALKRTEAAKEVTRLWQQCERSMKLAEQVKELNASRAEMEERVRLGLQGDGVSPQAGRRGGRPPHRQYRAASGRGCTCRRRGPDGIQSARRGNPPVHHVSECLYILLSRLNSEKL